MNCQWEEFETPDARGWRRVRCRKCGLTLAPTPHPLDKIHSVCSLGGEDTCIHRGESARAEECLSCNGSVKIKVFACAVHGECTIGKILEGIKCCVGCKDRL